MGKFKWNSFEIPTKNKSHGRCDLFLLWHLLKTTPTPPLLSHMDNVTLSNTFTPIYLISTPPTRVIQMMLFYLMLGLAPHGLDLGFLGLGLLGLGLWAWASSFAKTNKKNFKCFGPCPFLLLITSFWFSSVMILVFNYWFFSSLVKPRMSVYIFKPFVLIGITRK